MLQNDLIKEFKRTGVNRAADLVKLMNAETAAHLLTCTTKNVTSRLYENNSTWIRVQPAFPAIVSRIAAEYNPQAFSVLLEFLKQFTNEEFIKHLSWELFQAYPAECPLDLFIEFTKKTHTKFNITQEFFTNFISKIPSQEKYHLNSSVTDAFLYAATDQEKIQLLKGNLEKCYINWERSAIHFYSLPYETIQEFFKAEPKAREHFIIPIIKNKDIDNACALLISRGTFYWFKREFYDLFSILDYSKSIEVLRQTTHRCLDIKKIIPENKYTEFVREALLDINLSQYVSQLPVNYLSENITLTSVTARMLDKKMHVSLTYKEIDKLSKDEARILLKQAVLHFGGDRIAYLTTLYAKFTRNELLEFIPDLTTHSDFASLANHMLPDELVACCKRDRTFFMNNVNIIPLSYIKMFQNKNYFKELVQDCRNNVNKRFRNALLRRLSELDAATEKVAV